MATAVPVRHETLSNNSCGIDSRMILAARKKSPIGEDGGRAVTEQVTQTGIRRLMSQDTPCSYERNSSFHAGS